MEIFGDLGEHLDCTLTTFYHHSLSQTQTMEEKNKKRKIIPQNVSQHELDHFSSIPWCLPTISDPDFHIVSMSRTITDSGTGHTLMAQTWNTPETIPSLLSFYRAPSPSKRGEVRRFYTFGAGMSAHPGLLHGGVVATILDSTMGNSIGQEIRTKGPTFTVQLNVTYKNPIKLPGTIMVRSWVKKVEGSGRKIWVEGIIESERDEETVVHAKAEGLWVVGKVKL
jgi:acyl-coenzyme A thioesterase PaaI-like protein